LGLGLGLVSGHVTKTMH